MLIPDSEHKGYVPHMEFDSIVWYRTTKSKSGGISAKGKEIKYGTELNRIVTSTGDMEEAKKQLERRLSKPKTVPEIKAGPGQQSMF